MSWNTKDGAGGWSEAAHEARLTAIAERSPTKPCAECGRERWAEAPGDLCTPCWIAP